MKSKILSILLICIILLHSFCLFSYANNSVNCQSQSVLEAITSVAATNRNPNIRNIATITMDGNYNIESVNTSLYSSTDMHEDAYMPNDMMLYSQSNVTRDSNGLQELTGSSLDARVGKIVAYFDFDGDGGFDYTKTGTASLQSNDILISCMHVLWAYEWLTDEFDGWPYLIEFYAGQSSTAPYVASSNVIQYSFDVEYVNRGLNGEEYWDGDWAIIQIADNLGGRLGWLGLHGTNEPEIGFSVNMIGYPQDSSYPQYNGYGQFKSSGSLGNLIANNRIYINMFTCNGFSGAPIIKDGLVFAIAICRYNSSLGGAVRMVPWLFGMIVEAREESVERWT